MGRAMRKVPAAALAEDFQDFIVAHFPKILKESAYGKKWFRRGEVNQIVGNGVTSFVISESAKRVIPLSVGGIMGNSSWINWDS